MPYKDKDKEKAWRKQYNITHADKIKKYKKEYNKKYKTEKAILLNTYRREYYSKHKKSELTRMKNYRLKNLDKFKKYDKKLGLKKKYNLTIEQFEQMRIDQNNCCALCLTTFKTGKDTCVDHCHKTNKVRGLLCHKCNTGIGALNDSIVLLKKAIEYINYWTNK